MRKTTLGFILGCGLLAASALPALACPYNTQASADQQQQQTAQAQSANGTTTQ